jgi:hypothetical protein
MRQRRHQRSEFTFIEVMIASVILLITVLGVANFRYNSTINIMRGHAQNAATKVAVTLCDGWAGIDGTNPSAITLYSSAVVDGNLHVGVGGDPNSGILTYNNVVITGRKKALDWDWVPPDVVVPSYLLLATSKGTIRKDKTVRNDDKWDEINLRNSEILTINGDVTLYVTGDVLMGNGAGFVFTENISLVLYLGGDMA